MVGNVCVSYHATISINHNGAKTKETDGRMEWMIKRLSEASDNIEKLISIMMNWLRSQWNNKKNNNVKRRVHRDIPYHINKKILTHFDFHEIWYRHGIYKETFSLQNLADSINLPLSMTT